MGIYAVTGSASGMGKATAERLHAAGHTVIGVDLRNAEVTADLSTRDGRAHAAARVLELADGSLDGAVLAAGLGPEPGRSDSLLEVNYFGVVELLSAWRDALAVSGNSKVVVFASNSTTTVPLVPSRTIRALLAGDARAARTPLRKFRGNAPPLAYAASKIALSRWVRRAAVTPEWAGAGIRLNAIAPGAILTPLLQSQLDDPRDAKSLEAFPIPIGTYGNADQIAEWVMLMLSAAADFLVGSIVFVDGGTDAYFRADDWPRAVPLGGVLRYFRLTKSFAARKGPGKTPHGPKN